MLNFDPTSSVRATSVPNAASDLAPIRTPDAPGTFSAADNDPASTWTPSRPSLRSEYALLAATEDTRNLSDQIIGTLGSRIQCVRGTIQEVSKDVIHKLNENAERARTSNSWSTLKKIATCLVSATSMVFGISLLASGGDTALVGGAMIASGVLSLANFGMAENKGWDWVATQLANGNEERRKKIAMILPMTAGVVAGGIGLAGSVHGFATDSLQFAEKTLTIAQSAVTIFDGVTTFGKGHADAKLLWTQADLSLLQGLMTNEQTTFDSLVKEIEGIMIDFAAIKTKTKKTIQMISKENVQLVRI
jgi:hypothetical protein